MKKIISVILLACTVLSLISCGGNEKKPSSGGVVEKPANIKAWAFHSYEKTIVNSRPQLSNPTTDYTVYLSKGETEGCQVAIYSEKEFKNVSLKLVSGETELVKPSMYAMFRTHNIEGRQYTDGLIPYYGRKLTLNRRVTLPFMLEYTTDENTPAGDYKYVYELIDKDGNVLATYNITVHVWDFALPKDKTFATAAGVNYAFFSKYVGSAEEFYDEWYEMMVEHNICSYDVPFGILDPRADQYMSDPRVTAFRVPLSENGVDDINNIDEEKLLSMYKKLKSNPVWLEKAYFYPLDEPHTVDQLAQLKEWEKKLTSLCPEIEIVAPIYTNIQVGEGRDQTDEMEAYTDLWCPKLCLWDDEKSYGEFLDYTPSKSFHERMNEQIAKGDRMWSYVCNDPDDPYAQLFIDTEGVHQRLLFWQMYQRDIDGFLYWGTNYYGVDINSDTNGVAALQNAWDTVKTKATNVDGEIIYGCGFLFYPGRDVGVGGYVPSIRAKIIRDGVDDVELFYLAEKYLDKDWLLAKTKEGTPTLTSYSSGDEFAALRIEIGNALEEAMKK